MQFSLKNLIAWKNLAKYRIIEGCHMVHLNEGFLRNSNSKTKWEPSIPLPLAPLPAETGLSNICMGKIVVFKTG